MTPLVQAEGFGQSVLERQKGCRVRLRCWFNTDATDTGVIGYLQFNGWWKICLNTPLQCRWQFCSFNLKKKNWMVLSTQVGQTEI